MKNAIAEAPEVDFPRSQPVRMDQPMLTIGEWAAHTDVGPQRPENQDSFNGDVWRNVFCLADGIGGGPGGRQASSAAITAFMEAAGSGDDAEAAVRRALIAADDDVREVGRQDRRLAGLGTTLTGIRLVDHELIVGHVGDSRCYLLRNSTISVLTSDDSAEVKLGRRTIQTLTRFAGDGNCHNEPFVARLALQAGDRIILTSDGTHGALLDSEMADATNKANAVADAARKLVERALTNGTTDNASAVVIDIHDA